MGTTNDETGSFEPDIHAGSDLAGLSLNAAKKGQDVKVLSKAFFTSYEDDHRHFFNQILSNIPKLNIDGLNRVIIVLRGNKYHVYKNYPMMWEIRPKVDLPAGAPVFENQILDIRAIRFKDACVDLDIVDGDKFVWLFRVGWSFGLYFDFSGELKVPKLTEELADCYKKIKYHSLYSFLSGQDDFDRLLDLGWFPFAQILVDEFETLRLGLGDPSGIEMVEKQLIDSFTKERIERICNYWWKNEIFRDKSQLISAGITAYVSGTAEGFINCITTLTGQIEGILRLDYHRTEHRAPTTAEMKESLRGRAHEGFSNPGSLGFPGPFLAYIERVFFRSFDVEKGDVELSRHSVQHGVADQERFTKARALQLILVLDQLHFYLSTNKVAESSEPE